MELTISGNFPTQEPDRIREATDPSINERIDKGIEQRIRFYSFQEKETISERIHELDREWDIDRVLQTNAAGLSLFGVVMSILSGRKWLVLPLVVGVFLLQHGTQGWCPPLPVLRKLGIRTRAEIDQERFALKLLRGDFDNLERQQDGSFKRDVNRLIQDLRANRFGS